MRRTPPPQPVISPQPAKLASTTSSSVQGMPSAGRCADGRAHRLGWPQPAQFAISAGAKLFPPSALTQKRASFARPPKNRCPALEAGCHQVL